MLNQTLLGSKCMVVMFFLIRIKHLNFAYFNQPTSQQSVLTKYPFIFIQFNLFIYYSFIHPFSNLFISILYFSQGAQETESTEVMAQLQIDLPLVFIKMLFKYDYTYSYYLGLLSLYNGRAEQLLLRPNGLQSLKYLVSGPLQKKFAYSMLQFLLLACVNILLYVKQWYLCFCSNYIL